MMPIKLAYKNFFKSIREYTIYFITLLFAVVIFYMFNSLESQKELFEFSSAIKNSVELVAQLMEVLSVFIAIILGFLIVYANSYFIKRRKKELGIYQVLGMKKREISTIILTETIFVGLFSLTIGLFLGVMLSQFMATFTASLFEVSISKFQFAFSLSAIVKTLYFFVIIYFVVLVFNTIQIHRYPLIQLIQSERQNQKLRIKNTKIALILFIIAVCSLTYSYTQVLHGDLFVMTQNNEIQRHIINGVVMTFLLFYSLTGFLLQLFQKIKKVYYRQLNIFTLRQVHHKVNTHFISMSLISLMLFVTIGVFASGLSFKNMFEKNNSTLSFDVSYFISEVREEYKLSDRLLDPQFYHEKYQVAVYGRGENAITANFFTPDGANAELLPVMKQSDFNLLQKKWNQPTIEVKKGEYVFAENSQVLEANKRNEIQTPKIPWNQKQLEFKQKIKIDNRMSFFIGGSLIIVVADDDILPQQVFGERIGFDFKDYKTQAEKYQNLQEKELEYYASTTKYGAYVYGQQSKMAVTFIALYLGLIFLLASVTLLAIQQLVLIQESKSRYELLSKIGVDKKQLNRSNFQQISINFLTPLVFAMISAIVGMYALNRSLNQYLDVPIDFYSNMLYVGGGVFSLYVFYMLLTYIGSKNILK